MVGVGKNQACPNFLKLGRGDSFDGSLGADRGENRGEDIAMRRVEDSCPGTALLPGQGIGEYRGSICHIKRGLYPTAVQKGPAAEEFSENRRFFLLHRVVGRILVPVRESVVIFFASART